MSGPALLIVEDDPVIGESLRRALEGQGYRAAWARLGAEALEVAAAAPVDLVLLDLGLPDLSGLEVCRRLRALLEDVAIVILTARADEIDVVVGLDAGADDYVTKPFRLAELLARVRAQLRRRQAVADTDVLAAGEILLDRRSRQVWLASHEVALRPREFDLLELLMLEAGRALRREHIIAEVWDRNWFGPTRTLDMHVAALRAKLGDPARWGGITTLRGVGYRLELL
jgi:DNA-binding response OmpR family regulator